MYEKNLDYSLYLENKSEQSRWLDFFIIMLALLLNQSRVIAQVNFSFSDFFMVLIVIILFLKNSLFFPKKISLFFLFLSITTISAATLWVPIRLGVQAPIVSVFANIVKLMTVFMYFFVGYSLTKINKITIILKWFSIGAVSIAILAFLYTFISGLPLRQLLYFGESRFSGLMNDPNYFSVIQSSALVYILFNHYYKKMIKWLAFVAIVFSILVAGSKTGLITVVAICLLKLVSWIVSNPGNIIKKAIVLCMLFGLIFLGGIILLNLERILPFLNRYIPEFNRVSILFTNFTDALHAEGSTRDLSWGNALKLINLSPVFGIGVGTYSYIANYLFGSKIIAHNTYLQLFVEWGVPVALFSFSYLFWLIGKSLKKAFDFKHKSFINLMLIPFIIGSLALSLNNSRLFWVLFGAVFYYLKDDCTNS